MAELRPFRGLRYTQSAGELGSLIAPPTIGLTPASREGFEVRNPYNAVQVAAPEGHGDDRSKFIRYARAAARLAEWRRAGILAPEPGPAVYRLTQRLGSAAGDSVSRTVLLAVVDSMRDVIPVEASDPKVREERLRLLEATRTTFEPAIGYYEDPQGTRLAAVTAAPASSETVASTEGIDGLLEAIEDPDAIASILDAFRSTPVYVADGVEGFESARDFRQTMGHRDGAVPEDGSFLALASLESPSGTRFALHRVVRRLPGGMDRAALIQRLSTKFAVEEHHNRNLSVLMDQAAAAGRTTFGLATEGGLGYLLTPLETSETPAVLWFHNEILSRLLGVSEREPLVYLTDPVQAARAVNEGAGAAFLMPVPKPNEILVAARNDVRLPSRSASSYPQVPTGLVYWSMGDDA